MNSTGYVKPSNFRSGVCSGGQHSKLPCFTLLKKNDSTHFLRLVSEIQLQSAVWNSSDWQPAAASNFTFCRWTTPFKELLSLKTFSCRKEKQPTRGLVQLHTDNPLSIDIMHNTKNYLIHETLQQVWWVVSTIWNVVLLSVLCHTTEICWKY